MKIGSWQYNLFRAWIAGGGKFDSQSDSKLVRFELQPSEFIFADRDKSKQYVPSLGLMTEPQKMPPN